jgi:hypothetical protein
VKWERVAITGTAQSWKQTPWNDTGLSIMSLNDAYRMKGFVRADAWFDFHPLDRFFHPPKDQTIYSHQVPPGYYCRPSDHIAWLGRQTIPVYLHPDYRTQHPAAATWHHAHPFPKAEIEAEFGRYFTSSPAWMIAHALMQGVKELHIYGIHLATEHEYIEQRPNFEFLCGRLLGPSKVKTTLVNGIRRYETKDAVLFLPESSPVLNSDFQYAFQPRPRAALEPLKWEAHKVGIKRQRLTEQLINAPFWKRRKADREELLRLSCWAQDVQEQMSRLQAGA